MKIELVRIETADGMMLDGALSSGDGTQPSPWPAISQHFDSALLLHGVGSNFYQPRLLQLLSDQLEAAGLSTLRVNTRGHDTIHTVGTSSGAVRQGAALEIVGDCIYDIEGWLSLLSQQGRQRTLLLGHSLGAIKAVYWASQQTNPAVIAVAALSPPRLSADAFFSSADPRYLESLERAKQQVASGSGEQLIEVSFPFPMAMSAATYVDKYGGERYNIVELVGKLKLPTLFTYGERELSGGPFSGLPAQLRHRCGDAPIEVDVIAGADHSYAGRQPEVLAALSNYLENLG